MSHQDSAQTGTCHAPRERSFSPVAAPFEDLLHDETAGGLLLLCTIATLILANSPQAHAHHDMLDACVGFTAGEWSPKLGIHLWINDGLMAPVLFVVGLEIKRGTDALPGSGGSPAANRSRPEAA